MTNTIRQTDLPNGLTVLTDTMAGVRSVTLGFFFRTGARHEPKELHGISHFIEHTVFKGTLRQSALEIAVLQDRLGGNLEAFTTHEETGFAIKVIDDRLVEAFDLMADILLNPRFDEPDLRAERKVIIEEMKMIDDSPEEYLGDLFNTAYFPDHPLGRSITGTPKTVRSFNSRVTADFHRSTYTPQNLVIAAAGNVAHNAVVKMARSMFDTPTRRSRKAAKLRKPTPAAPLVIKNDSRLEQAHLVIAVPMVAATDKRRYAAEMLSSIIGGGTSSRLWQKVREERGLAYNVGASTVMYQDCGLFTVFAGTSPSQVRELVGIVMEELRSVVSSGVTHDELDLAKQQAVASILLSLEDSAARAAAIAQSEMVHGRQIPVEETIASVNAVSPADIRNLARRCFRTEKLAFAALGDLKSVRINRGDLSLD
jgi:predicted Zn-dependent peptidase